MRPLGIQLNGGENWVHCTATASAGNGCGKLWQMWFCDAIKLIRPVPSPNGRSKRGLNYRLAAECWYKLIFMRRSSFLFMASFITARERLCDFGVWKWRAVVWTTEWSDSIPLLTIHCFHFQLFPFFAREIMSTKLWKKNYMRISG